MNIFPFIGIGIISLLFILYWFLTFHLIEQLLGPAKLKNIHQFLLSIVNTFLVFAINMLFGGAITSYLVIFTFMLFEFWILYRSTFIGNLFCSLACIIHIEVIGSMVIGLFSMVTGYSVYQLLITPFWLTTSIIVIFIFLAFAIIGVLNLIPLNYVRMIIQRKQQRLVLILWMSISSLYLLYNTYILYQPHISKNFSGNPLETSIVIIVSLYVVLFFMIKSITITDYKEKSAALTQEVVQARQYRDSITKDALIAYKVNLTQNKLIQGLEDIWEKFGTLIERYSDLSTFIANKIIHSDDIMDFKRYASPNYLLNEFSHGNSEVTIQYRRLTETGTYMWVKSITNLIQDVETQDIIAYVYIRDIDKEKRRQLELQQMAERDPLTGLYNKEITAKLINEHLRKLHRSVNSSLFIIDVDNFKTINDHFGHLYGDVVLCELGDKLRCIFKTEDIIGRIGGDEYIVYIKTTLSLETIEEKANAIIKAFHITYNGLQGDAHTISASVGIALFPKDGATFEELYQYADAALYKAKNDGKGKYQLYDGSDFSSYSPTRTEHLTADIIFQKSFRDNRSEYVFKILYHSPNAIEAIYAVLELVTIHFGFERGYIFETSEDKKTTSNTFEWCKNGVTPEIEHLQNIPIEAASTANENFYKNGIYIVKTLRDLPDIERAILEPQNIKSMIQFGIFDKRNLIGFIGFDNCTNEILLGKEETKEIEIICNILATFFVKHRMEELLEKLAFVDELTGSRTYYKFTKDAEEILKKQPDISHFLVKLDIDNFKLINQIYGYEKGDAILCSVAKALGKVTRNEDEIFARVAADDFVALFALHDDALLPMFYESFLHNFSILMEEDFTFKYSFSYGISIIRPEDTQALDVKYQFEKANIAQKVAKLDKTLDFVIYDDSMTEKVLYEKEIENKMVNALQNHEFVVYLQPKYYLDTEMIGGAEALTRWKNKNADLFFPDSFIPVFEKNGFITKLDFYVLQSVCTMIKQWMIDGIQPVTISVNFSRLHINNPHFVNELCKIVDSTGIDRKYIEIEITETVIYDNIDALKILQTDLHKNGFTISMDDFGSGYSSLGMLKDLAFDVIKMDRSFFVNPKDAFRSKIVVGSIIEMASRLGIRIIAEGIEEQEYINLLRDLHCDMVQGYYYARPMPMSDFTALIKYPTKFSPI